MMPIALTTKDPIKGWEAGLTWVFVQSFVLMAGGFVAPIIRKITPRAALLGTLAVIKEVRESVKEGKLLADCMAKSGFFPSMAVQMIRVGEETGELAKMLGHVAAFYKGQVEEFMKRIATLIEPVMLVVMGGVIGTIVVAMFLPLISLSTGS